jgi:hypothetical protein
MSRRLAFLALVLVVLSLASPVWAHVGAPPAGLDADAPPVAGDRPDTIGAESVSAQSISAMRIASPGPWLLTASAAVALALTLRRRRALTLALVLLLACGAFEAGLHSVHHLTEVDAAKCAVAAVSSHTGGVVVVTVAVERPVDVVAHVAPPQVATLAPSMLFAPDLGRAPPAA